ncbi:endo-1,4-beta-xylanase [Streptomyces galbus]|uniref:Beta-xylanase n=1 Tax=Streptomyces galbus TaxID=33898 RepID=A0ABX1IRJ6_STRGB|nr:endo-1,4-beta-xylanase [Streptomyces galbus]NKQ28261.1 endo-1,4-beta-xylanase [Streptomyces galbus]
MDLGGGTWQRLTAVLLVMAVAAGGTGQGQSADGGGEDLLRNHDWTQMPGTTARNGILQVSALDRRIVEQDASGGRPNPPLNLAGPHLRSDGDFTVTARMSGVGDHDGASWLRLYGQVPVIYDEWRQERPSLRVGVTADGHVKVQIWDGASDEPATSREFDCGCSGTVTLTVSSIGDTFRVKADGRRLGTVQDPGVFAEGTVWFGLEADAGDDERREGWRLTQLTARAESGDALRVIKAPQLRQEQSEDSLRARAADVGRPFDVGTALAENPLLTDSRYRALAGSQFSMLTPENAFKPQFLHPRPDVYDFRDADLLVRFARANHMKVHAHTLVWHEALPHWMRQNDDPEEVRRTMLRHITAVAGHFKGEVAEWDVVNEPMSDDDESYTDGDLGLRSEQNPWFEAMGEEYIDEAFKAAHRADPNARLFLNEYGIEEEGERWDALYDLVRRLKERGVPIDGVGFQNHEYAPADRTDPETFRAHVRDLAELGLQARVSEMDVPLGEDEEDGRQTQAEEMAGKLRVCLQEPNCTSFSTWGFTDRYGSTADTKTYPPRPADSLPWDTALRPKPAYERLLETFDEA